MAEAKLPREPDQGFAARLVPDPAAPPELRLLVGYPGASSVAGHTRLYASPDLGSWWEIPEDAVLHRKAVPGDPLGAEILWIRRDQQPVLIQGRSDSMYTYPTVTYLTCPTGPVQHQPYTIAGLNCGTGPVQHHQPTLGYGCGPGPVQPPTHICTFPPPVTQYCGTTPVGAAALPPTFLGFCTVPPPSAGCQHPITVAMHPTHDVNCGTSPVGAQPQQAFAWPPFSFACTTTPVGPAQPQPSLNYPTIPPHTVCCR